jgi:uncharacterized protein (TIGR01777 family)
MILNILVTGSTGLIGTELCSFLSEYHYRVLRMVRRAPANANEIQWDPIAGIRDTSVLEGLDAVVHLAGENIASGRWTPERMQRIRESRILGTRLLAQSLARLFDPPKVLVSISAVGYYGDRGEELLDEGSSVGKGFLPDLCREWENAPAAATMRHIRVVTPRLGTVLSAAGGALARMLPPFRLGFGGTIGSGNQYMSWIAIDDLIGIIHQLIVKESFQGPINVVSPNPITNREFSDTLGRILSRPVFFNLPSFAARLALGKMADETLLSSARVSPKRLMKANFPFAFPELEEALRYILEKPKA